MAALLDYLAVVEHDDAVSQVNTAEALGDEHCGHPLKARLEVAENGHLGFSIYCAQRIVKEQDRRVLHQGPRNAHALLLSARKGHAALAHNRVEPLRKPANVISHVGEFSLALNFGSVGVEAAECDVVGDRIAEEKGILRHGSDRSPKGLNVPLAQIYTVK